MRIFFPNGTIAYPPTLGTDVHKYQLTKNLTELGYEIVTFSRDQNPLTTKVRKRPVSVVRMVRASDIIYVRTGEGTSLASQLTSPLFRNFIPDRSIVIWEMNLGINLKVRRKPRNDSQVKSDLQRLKRQAERVDAAICVSRSIAEEARELLGIENVFTIQNGSDPEIFRPDLPKISLGSPETSQNRLQVAWIASEKNAIHDAKLVLDLAQLIEQRDLPIHIHAMGNLKSFFSARQPSSVTIHGPVSYFDLPRYLASMDAGLVLYNLKYDGGSPLKLFDYCASACVPVCSPGQSVEEVLAGSDAGLVQQWSAESLCNALVDLAEDNAKLQRMAGNARKVVTRTYNWKSIAKKTDEIIKECIRRRA